MNGIVRDVFIVVASMLIAVLLYTLFFVGDNCAMVHICNAIERPVAKYYNDMALYPSVHADEGLAESLGVTFADGNDFDGSASKDNASSASTYSTGWFTSEDIHSNTDSDELSIRDY